MSSDYNQELNNKSNPQSGKHLTKRILKSQITQLAKAKGGLDNNLEFSKEHFLDVADHTGEISKAEAHLKANMIYNYEKLDMNYNLVDLCDDCMCPIPKDSSKASFNLCDDTKLFANFGVGIYLYFFYIKYIGFLILVALAMICIPQIYYTSKYLDEIDLHCLTKTFEVESYDENFNSTVVSQEYINDTDFSIADFFDIPEGKEYCQFWVNITNNRDLSWLWDMSYEVLDRREEINREKNKEDLGSTVDFNLLHFLHEITIIVINLISFVICYNLTKEVDAYNLTPEDFTLIVSYVPKEMNESELKEYLKVNDNINILEVNKTYKLNQFYVLKQK